MNDPGESVWRENKHMQILACYLDFAYLRQYIGSCIFSSDFKNHDSDGLQESRIDFHMSFPHVT